ncbi:hypothetical protein MHYP_G00062600 [Metynnis hypsauchen]
MRRSISVKGLGEDRKSMGWTMSLKDGFGGTGWLWRAGNFLLLSMSLVVVQVWADFSKDTHYSWKTGTLLPILYARTRALNGV